MATTNPVYNVLATAGNQAPLAKDNDITALRNGQIGIFDYHTNKSVDGSVLGNCQEIYLAVGINRTAGGTNLAEDISKSAGQMIQIRNTKALTIKGYVDPVQQIWDISLTQAFCNVDYAFKLTFDSTSLAMINGYNQIRKSWSYSTDKCPSSTDNTILPSNVLIDLKSQINNDPDKAVTAFIVDPTTTPGTPVVLADQAAVDTYLAASGTNRVQLRIVGNSEARPALGDVNIKYYKTNRTFYPTLIGFDFGSAVEARAAQTVEGTGYDIKQLENFAKGWGKPGPYRTNAITGLPNSVESFINQASNYNVISLSYDQFSVGGWLEYLNNLETIIAIPCADSTTLTGLITMFDAIFKQFAPSTNDVASMDCTNTNISTINDVALDGISIGQS